MDARSRLEAEFAREAAENEAALLLKLLRARVRELTLGDLLALLDTAAGARLQHRRLDELIDGDITPPAAPVGPATESDFRALLAALQASERPLSARELAERTGDSLARCAEGIDSFLTVGLVELAEDGPQPRYRPSAASSYQPTISVLTLAALLVSVLRRSGRRMQLMELRRATGCSEERVRRAVQHLKRIRALTTTGQNSGTRYGLVDAPTPAAH